MNEALHPAADHDLPSFITAPGATDLLMVITAVILLSAVVAFGLVFLRLHTLPERIAHRGHKLQFEIVAVLGLISLFTHMHIFWIMGLLLALIDLPDFGTPLNRIAGSAERIAGINPGDGDNVDLSESIIDEPMTASLRIHDKAEEKVSASPSTSPKVAPVTKKRTHV
jgi:hypothetical protein